MLSYLTFIKITLSFSALIFTLIIIIKTIIPPVKIKNFVSLLTIIQGPGLIKFYAFYKSN